MGTQTDHNAIHDADTCYICTDSYYLMRDNINFWTDKSCNYLFYIPDFSLRGGVGWGIGVWGGVGSIMVVSGCVGSVVGMVVGGRIHSRPAASKRVTSTVEGLSVNNKWVCSIATGARVSYDESYSGISRACWL